jgi:hypothetical protein
MIGGRSALLAAALIAGTALPASAQVTRGYVTIGGGYQSTQNDFSDGGTKSLNAETGTFDTSFGVPAGPSIEGAVGVTLWKQFGVRIGAGRFNATTLGDFEASLPHPFFFNQARNLTGEVAGLQRQELAFDVHLAGVFALSPRLQAAVFAGPSWLQIRQGMVTDFEFTEAYPYDTATFTRATTTTATGSKMGFGAGAALGYFFTSRIGIEANARVSQSEVPLTGATGSTRAVKAGGFKAGVGVIARF